ncbi:hypothetical protein J4219_01800 [Candidatus Woesearchaeota archaeon]|nr:hypothetical protein [Candidatus Woesearchaeota archaeon]
MNWVYVKFRELGYSRLAAFGRTIESYFTANVAALFDFYHEVPEFEIEKDLQTLEKIFDPEYTPTFSSNLKRPTRLYEQKLMIAHPLESLLGSIHLAYCRNREDFAPKQIERYQAALQQAEHVDLKPCEWFDKAEFLDFMKKMELLDSKDDGAFTKCLEERYEQRRARWQLHLEKERLV